MSKKEQYSKEFMDRVFGAMQMDRVEPAPVKEIPDNCYDSGDGVIICATGEQFALKMTEKELAQRRFHDTPMIVFQKEKNK